MIKFLADENLRSSIFKGLRSHYPEVDIVRVQDVGLRGSDDEAVLQWAADQERILLTHDVSTIGDFVLQRLAKAKPMPGVLYINCPLSNQKILEELHLIATCTSPEEWQGQCAYLPLPSTW
jgi:predicted nuclease of predicted toxin-antitoxin system